MKFFACVLGLLVIFAAAPCMAGDHNYDGRWTFQIISDDHGCDKCEIEVYDDYFDTVLTGSRICVDDEGQQDCFNGTFSGNTFTFTQVIRGEGFKGSGEAVVTFTSPSAAEFVETATFKTGGCSCTSHFSGPGTKN